ncbi:hypothetical protein ACFXTI_022868 [Malus domestica]
MPRTLTHPPSLRPCNKTLKVKVPFDYKATSYITNPVSLFQLHPHGDPNFSRNSMLLLLRGTPGYYAPTNTSLITSTGPDSKKMSRALWLPMMCANALQTPTNSPLQKLGLSSPIRQAN